MISVCMATYNGERFIRRQLETILAQLGSGDEIVVSDDGSTDNTLKVIESMASPLIHVYVNGSDHGYTPNFENALKHARGEYIFLADQDDVWQPGKVEACMEALSSCDFVVSDAVIVDAEENVLHPSFFRERLHFKGFWGNMLTMGYVGCCMAFRRKILERALPFPPEHLLCTHDNWLMIVSLAFYRVKVLERQLISYRRHDGNASLGTGNAKASWGFRVKYRAYLLWCLLRRARVRHPFKK